jgi:hypothetical protein
VERSIEEFRLEEPLDPAQLGVDETHFDAAGAPARVRGRPEIQAFPGNPLRDEPSPASVAAVRRFGIVGLVTVALGAGLRRWWSFRQH